jgi:protein ImuB
VSVPLVFVRTVATRQVVTAVSDGAAGFGIRIGMTLAQGRALCAHVESLDHHPAADARALEALGRYLQRFSPVVMPVIDYPDAADGKAAGDTGFQPVLGGLGGEEPAAAPHGSFPRDHGVYLDLTGCERLFNGLDRLVGQLAETLVRLRLRFHLAVAENPAKAWALTFAPDDVARARRPEETPAARNAPHRHSERSEESSPPSHEPPGSSAPSTSPQDATRERFAVIAHTLPIEGLRLPEDLLASLHHLGLETIGQLLDLPRASLPSRFGTVLTRRINQLLGHEAEPLLPLPYLVPVEARTEFDGPVPSTEALIVAFESLLPGVLEQLARRGLGARRIDVQLIRAYAPTIHRTIHLSRPTRNTRTIMNLFRCVLETIGEREGQGARGKAQGKRRSRTSNSDPSAGFLGLHVAVPSPEGVTEEQIDLVDSVRQVGAEEFNELLARLRLRLGDGIVVRPVPVESHLPERAWRDGKDKDEGRRACPELVEGMKDKKNAPVASGSSFSLHPSSFSSRPLHLLARPVEIPVMVSPSHDRDGRPISFRADGEHHTVVHFTGPERIAGVWWTGHDKTRDYFEAEVREGLRFWMFRVLETAKWYLHGTFE